MWIFFHEYKIYMICNQPWKEEAMVQEGKNQWNTAKWELEMATFPVLLGLGRRLHIWEVEQSKCSFFMTSGSLQWQPQSKGVHAEQVFIPLCDGMLENSFCMMEFPRLVRETWDTISESVFTCDWASESLTVCQPPNCWLSWVSPVLAFSWMFQHMVSNQHSQLHVAVVMAKYILAQINQKYNRHFKKQVDVS